MQKIQKETGENGVWSQLTHVISRTRYEQTTKRSTTIGRKHSLILFIRLERTKNPRQRQTTHVANRAARLAVGKRLDIFGEVGEIGARLSCLLSVFLLLRLPLRSLRASRQDRRDRRSRRDRHEVPLDLP